MYHLSSLLLENTYWEILIHVKNYLVWCIKLLMISFLLSQSRFSLFLSYTLYVNPLNYMCSSDKPSYVFPPYLTIQMIPLSETFFYPQHR